MNVQRPLGPVVVDLKSQVIDTQEQQLLSHPLVGGVILFSRNYASVKQLLLLVKSIRKVNPNLVIMVDQEGGRVQRFKKGFTRLPALQKIGELYTRAPHNAKDLAFQHAWLMASELLSVGIDLSLAPVLDLDDCFSEVIGDRSFGPNAEATIALAGSYIEGMNAAGMEAVAKHFPGHGVVKRDSHKTLPVSEERFAVIQQTHMLPFAQLVNDYAGVMPAHIVYKEIDARPVGFSSHWLQHILRQQMGFKGAIFSDDLSMEGAAWAGDYCARADAALSAGCNVILVCNAPAAAGQVVAHLERQACDAQSGLEQLKGRLPETLTGPSSLSDLDLWQNCARNLSAL